MASIEAPKWLFPLLEANFRTARTSNGGVKNYVFFCMTCMGHPIREVDKPNHPGHEFLQAVKASHHFAVWVLDMNERLNCKEIAIFKVNDNKIFYLNSRVKPELLENGRVNRNSNKSGSSKRTCTICGWRLPESSPTSRYCSLGCKFKRNDGIFINPRKVEDLISEELPMVNIDQHSNAEETNGMKEESKTMMNFSSRARSRKGIPVRSPIRTNSSLSF